MRARWILVVSGLYGLLGVALGAFAAHGLKSKLSPLLIEVFKTGVLYQFIHTLAILACGVLLQLNLPIKAQKYFFNAAVCFIIGVLCFSGSLYALALTGIHWFGPITPIGGVLFMIGWLMLILAAVKMKEGES
ncbi:DUF423 domain-containing protein [Vibrio marisflavi]|uniref:DUF423 domain-containing protein n=1 Tax=Vibrio marisflavi CECT 7928 TaxID=634439 RepID=A0ABN8E757_9VIBR|nr:DUF423 domain-containing protein [Vibrio marisflavi]CAH0538925.1 hypothetical protein VMF7928_01760 [Vibrio marisflavi CECT 7928]